MILKGNVMISVEPFTRDKIGAVLEFEAQLRRQEPDTFFMDAGEDYRKRLEASFEDSRFANAVSLLAWENGRVIGRTDAVILAARSDAGCGCAYLDWICVLKEERHRQAAQLLLGELRRELKRRGVQTLIAIMAHNPEAERFYRAVENASIHDEAVWMDL